MEKKLIQMFQDRGCLQVKEKDAFLYASGLRGPIYCDNRLILGEPELRDLVVERLIDLIKKNNIQFGGVMAMATGAIPIGTMIADKLSLPLGYVRSSKKAHGKGSLIEGGVDSRMPVLVVEDLINQGASIIKGIESLTEESYQVAGVVSIINYHFPKSSAFFTERKIPCFSLIGFEDIVDFFNQRSDKSETSDALLEWHRKTASST